MKVVYFLINEEDHVYHKTEIIQTGLDMLAEFPNDKIAGVVEGSPYYELLDHLFHHPI